MAEPETQPLLSSQFSFPFPFEENGTNEISSSETQTEEEQLPLPRTKSGLQRCKTAPAMDMAAVLRELQANLRNPNPNPPIEESRRNGNQTQTGMVRQAGVLLLLYLIMGVIVYGLNRDKFSGVETHPVVDALYFCIVTMCTIGYGDITPLTPSTKLFACLFVLVGFGFIDILLTGVVNHVLDLQEKNILSDIYRPKRNTKYNPLVVDVTKGRMRIRLKVALALAVVILCIGFGTLVLYFMEDLTWVDSLYLSALSVTTVGYGDRAFTTLAGGCSRLFGCCSPPWLWLGRFSTLWRLGLISDSVLLPSGFFRGKLLLSTCLLLISTTIISSPSLSMFFTSSKRWERLRRRIYHRSAINLKSLIPTTWGE